MLLRLATRRAHYHHFRRFSSTTAAAEQPAVKHVKHGAGRTILGIIAGSASVVAWCGVRPDVIADIPFSGVVTTLVGCGVCRLVAPQASILAMVAGFVVTGTATVVGGSALALRFVDQSVPLTPEEFEGINNDIQKYVGHQHKEGSIDSLDVELNSKLILYASKGLWQLLESELDLPKDSQGRSVLTRKAAETFAIKVKSNFCKTRPLYSSNTLQTSNF